jgi:hypothetical protein
MADLYNLLDEIQEDEDQIDSYHEEAPQIDQDDEEDREHVELMPHWNDPTERREKQRALPGTPDTDLNVTYDEYAEGEERLDLEDVVGEAGQQDLVVMRFLEDQQDEMLLLQSQEGDDALQVTYAHLRHVWTQEIQAPTILPLNYELVQTWSRVISSRENVLDEFPLQDPDSASTHNHQRRRRGADPQEKPYDDQVWSLLQSVLRVDLERARFLLCDLLRTRLLKLQQYPWYYLKEQQNRLIPPEVRISLPVIKRLRSFSNTGLFV